MEPIFTLAYPEHAVIAELSDCLKKGDGCSCYIPVSRQEKDIDFILMNAISGKHLRFQVKSSRSWEWEETKEKESGHHFWFKNLIGRFRTGTVDYYILFGIYPMYSMPARISAKHRHWKTMILCLSEAEMGRLLRSVRTKKTNKPDSFFSVWKDSRNKYYGGRGFRKDPSFTKYLLENKIEEIRKRMAR